MIDEAPPGFQSPPEEDLGRAKEKVRPGRAKRNGGGDREAARPEIVWYRDALLETTSHHVIKTLINAETLVVIRGGPGSAKTFCILDMGCHVAAGLPWRGLKVRSGVVLYLAPEAGRSLLRRVIAWRRHHGVDDAKLAVRPLPVDLLRADADTAKIIAICKEIAATHGEIVLIIVDTVARAMPGGKENAPEDMGAFVANCDRIRAETGAAVALVHHTGKDESRGSRGHNSLPAAVDTEIAIADHIATIAKQRDGVAGAQFPFRLQVVDLGVDDEGDRITSCVALPDEASDAAGKATKRTKLNARQEAVLAAIGETIAANGQDAPASNHIPKGARVATLEAAINAAERTITLPEGHRRRSEVRRVIDALRDRGAVAFYDPYIWVSK